MVARLKRKLSRIFDRVIGLRMRARTDIKVPRDVIFRGLPLVENAPGASISFGPRTVLCSRSSDTALGVTRPVIVRTLRPGAEIRIANDVGISGAAICAARSIRIGSRTLIGSEVIIADTDFHPLPYAGRRSAPVPIPKESDGINIGEDVFIGARAVILKGVQVGDGSVVGAGSIVTRDVAPYTIVAGNPARAVGSVPSA